MLVHPHKEIADHFLGELPSAEKRGAEANEHLVVSSEYAFIHGGITIAKPLNERDVICRCVTRRLIIVWTRPWCTVLPGVPFITAGVVRGSDVREDMSEN